MKGMSREIKFRLWLGHTKKMTYTHTLAEVSKIIPEFTDDIVPLQFTGLKDKNGKEIYEGDVVMVFHSREDEDDGGFFTTGKVEYSPAEFYINGGGYSITCHFHYNASDREVLGNIYENPELIPNGLLKNTNTL